MHSFFRKVYWLTRRSSREADLRAELQFHLEEEAEERAAQGLPDQQARRAARRDLGNLTLVQENTRAVWGWTALEQFGQDLRYAFRNMAANRLFTFVAVVSLALGIGANTAIYSFMDAILVRGLPVPDPESLVVLTWHAAPSNHGETVMQRMSGSTWGDAKSGEFTDIFPFPAFALFRHNDALFSTVFGYHQSWLTRSLNLVVKGQAGIGSGVFVTGDYFGGLAVAPAAGRPIGPDDDRVGAPPVVMVSYAFSEQRLGGAANAPGQSILINNRTFTVAGVTPPEFFGIDPNAAPTVYLPMHANEVLGASNQFGFRPEAYLDRNYYWLQIMGRLRPGVSLEQAQATLAPAFHAWVAATATNDAMRAHLPELQVKPGAGGLSTLRRKYSKPLFVLMTMVALILALACANVANLLLARATARHREMALRLSMGAGRSRLVRQLLTESVLLASLGGVLGLLFASWGMRALTLLLANGRANYTLRAELNGHVLGVALGLSLVTGVLFGLAPALEATGVDVMPALKATRAGERAARRSLWRTTPRRLLMAGQIAISLLMLVGAGLFVRTLSNLQSIELGFTRENILLFQLDARKAGHKDAEIAGLYGDLRNRFSTIPGVRSVSLSEDSLVQAGTGLPIGLPGQPPDGNNRILCVGPAFLTTMQIPILAGRDFQESDGPVSPAVAIVNQVFAKTNFGDRNPLGQRLILRKAGPGEPVGRDMEIVGVARNALYGGITRKIPPLVYLPYNQGYPQPGQMVFALRTAGDPLRYVNSVREIVRQADARVPVSEIRTQTQDIDRSINQEILFARLCTGFAILALAIACVGLYGTVSYNVARRTAEIGIRMALGAQRGLVVRMILRDVLLISVTGLVAGLPVALAAGKFVESLLYGLKPNDPLALAVAALSLLVAAVAAGYVPARKAARIDPMTALRNE